jgi:8-oxo-dGTP pyrophosphatase MutT (NUDIX family)
MTLSLLDLLDQITAIAQLGLNYTKDPHDRLRYDRLLELASAQYQNLTGLPSQTIKERFTKELGYITPKIGVQGALFNEEGLLLLEHRSDDHLWGLPAGWAEVGERPEQTIVREFLEETALIVEPTNILGFYSRLPGEYDQPHTSVHILYLCKYLGGNIKISHESHEMKYCNPNDIHDWHKDHRQQAFRALEAYHSPGTSPAF